MIITFSAIYHFNVFESSFSDILKNMKKSPKKFLQPTLKNVFKVGKFWYNVNAHWKKNTYATFLSDYRLLRFSQGRLNLFLEGVCVTS